MATKEEILDSIAQMSVIELSELIEATVQRFNIKVPVHSTEPQTTSQPIKEEQEFFAVVIKSGGDKKIKVIQVVREVTGLGLKESKEVVDNCGTVKKDVSRSEADEIKRKLEEFGATVELV